MRLLLLFLAVSSALSDSTVGLAESTLNGISFKKNNTNGIYSGEGCDFSGNNVKILKMKKEDCVDKCNELKNCNHFAYNLEKGQCSLKFANFTEGDEPSPIAAEGIQCGYKAMLGFKFWKMHYSAACDYWGYNFKTLEDTTPESCIESCEADTWCTHITWKKGSCKLKMRLPKGVKPWTADAATICARKDNFTANWLSGYGTFLANGCKFEEGSAEVEVVKASTDIACATKCTEHLSCSHFNWLLGGNCTLILGLDKDAVPKCDNYHICGFVKELRNGGEVTCHE